MGWSTCQPYPTYRHVFALPDESLARLAYYFTYSYRDWRDPRAYTRAFRQAVEAWPSAYTSSHLFFMDEATGCSSGTSGRPRANRLR